MATISKSQKDTKSHKTGVTDTFRRAERQRYLLVKRLFDLLVCLVSFPLVFCLIVLFTIAIVLDSPGSPFFIQERVGKNGRRFRMYKFRSMKHDYDEPNHRLFMQAFVAGKDIVGTNNPADATNKPPINNYITRVGSILRKTSLDELPQIINVLKGEMSLIGPRPNVTWEVEKYKDWHYERLKVLPGITGLAQVRGRSNITFDEIVRNDIEYIENQSLKFDLQILWWTLLAVVDGNGAG